MALFLCEAGREGEAADGALGADAGEEAGQDGGDDEDGDDKNGVDNPS